MPLNRARKTRDAWGGSKTVIDRSRGAYIHQCPWRSKANAGHVEL